MPISSTVTGRPLAPRTIAGYAADWSLFTDWCAATHHEPLPTDAPTIAAFTTACPAAPATQRRRLAAIAHHHRAAGQEISRGTTGPRDSSRRREHLDPDLVATALRLLPSHGWTAGLFGLRDKALLALAGSTDLSYRELAVMRVAQLDIVDGAAAVIDTSGDIRVVEAAADPVLCGPCALVRWRRILDVEVGGISAAGLRQLFTNAPVVTPDSGHVCRAPEPINPKTWAAPLFPPINQWGHLPLPVQPMSRHAVSILARQIETGFPAHRDLNVGDVVDVLSAAEPPVQEPSVPRPPYDWAAANQKKKEAIAQLASLTATMDDLDTRIKELLARTRNLDLH